MDKYTYITTEEANFKTVRVPITGSKDWNMFEHIEKCTNVANGWYHKGENGGSRPYRNVVEPVLMVNLRARGFDVKNITPFVTNSEKSYKSFLVKKYHDRWAKKNQLDKFIDDFIYNTTVYDLVLIKDIGEVKPEITPLQQIAFCDQTDVLSGDICLKHSYSLGQLKKQKNWNKEAIEILSGQAENSIKTPYSETKVKAPGKYITVYELHSYSPVTWIEGREGEDSNEYVEQINIVAFYNNDKGERTGITLYSKELKEKRFEAFVLNPVYGRACGRSLIETLFQPQQWVNYNEIKIKDMLDSAALTIFQTASREFDNQNLSNLKNLTVLKSEMNKPVTKLDNSSNANLVPIVNHQARLEADARVLGSATDAQLGLNPTSGTPFALQELVVAKGDSTHIFNRGRISSFFSDVLYTDRWILGYLKKDMNKGQSFSEVLSLDEMERVAKGFATEHTNEKIMETVLKKGVLVEKEQIDFLQQFYKDELKKDSDRVFMKIFEDEMQDLDMEVFVDVAGKQRDMIKNAQTLTNILRDIIANIDKVKQIPGLAKMYNQAIEESGYSPIDFSQSIETPSQPIAQPLEQGQAQLA